MGQSSSEKEAKIISFSKAKKEKLEERRRSHGRVLYKHVLGAYCVSQNEGLRAVELVDISREGLSFQLPHNSKNLSAIKVGQETMLRLYFTKDTYLELIIKIQNSRECLESGQSYVRFGCAVDSRLHSYEAYKLFVEFLMKYVENSHHDKGDLKVFFF